MITRQRPQVKRFEKINFNPEACKDVKKWNSGPVKVNLPSNSFPCQECEEDIDEIDHYPYVYFYIWKRKLKSFFLVEIILILKLINTEENRDANNVDM